MSLTKEKWEIGTEPGGHFSISPDKSITVWRSPNAAEKARLIAASPELLEACKAVVMEIGLLKTHKLDVLPMVKAAIASAEA